jgi:hypothetical protein
MRPMIIGLLLVLLIAGGVAIAQNGYGIPMYTTVPGGISSGGGYTLKGASGQANATVLIGSNYTLTGGLVSAQSGQNSNAIYLPVIRTD